jgi:MarR family transcriptional repressor of mepA
MKPVWELISKVLGNIADNENHLLAPINEAEQKIEE